MTFHILGFYGLRWVTDQSAGTKGHQRICRLVYAAVFTISERDEEKMCAERDKRKQRQIIPDISLK